jgi:hypothetical protein
MCAEVVVDATVARNAVLDEERMVGVGSGEAIREDLAQYLFVASHRKVPFVFFLMFMFLSRYWFLFTSGS